MSAPDFNERSKDIIKSGESLHSEPVHYQKEQILNFANTINENDDYLYGQDKKELKKFKVKLKDFKKTLPDNSKTKLIIRKQKQIHN